jgi:hypothetical protein
MNNFKWILEAEMNNLAFFIYYQISVNSIPPTSLNF